MNSHDCKIPFCGFPVVSAHGLTTHVSCCYSKQKRQLLQADVDPCEKNRVPPSRFRYANSTLLNYTKTHFCSSASSTVPFSCKRLRRVQDDDEGLGYTTQPRTRNSSIPCETRDALQGRDTKIESPSTSIGNQMNKLRLCCCPAKFRA